MQLFKPLYWSVSLPYFQYSNIFLLFEFFFLNLRKQWIMNITLFFHTYYSVIRCKSKLETQYDILMPMSSWPPIWQICSLAHHIPCQPFYTLPNFNPSGFVMFESCVLHHWSAIFLHMIKWMVKLLWLEQIWVHACIKLGLWCYWSSIGDPHLSNRWSKWSKRQDVTIFKYIV